MSKNLGIINNKFSAVQFWGGDSRGVCLQITNHSSNESYIQVTAAEAVALIPILKTVIDAELKRQSELCDEMIRKNQEMKKTIIKDMSEVAKMAINQKILDCASMLCLGGAKVEIDE